jgi:putative ABC transport system permease protein
VVVLSQPELVAWERRYWEEATPIGFIFAFGSLMGLVVGMVIVYQILFSDIASHLREYATLKALGYSGWYLGRAVLSAALILAVLGFLPASPCPPSCTTRSARAPSCRWTWARSARSACS